MFVILFCRWPELVPNHLLYLKHSFSVNNKQTLQKSLRIAEGGEWLQLPGMSAAESGIPDLRVPLATSAREKVDWANHPISSVASLLTNSAGSKENDALISAKVLQATRFQTKQSGSMNQIVFPTSSTYRWDTHRQEKSPFHSPAVEVFFLLFLFRSCCLQPIYTILY